MSRNAKAVKKLQEGKVTLPAGSANIARLPPPSCVTYIAERTKRYLSRSTGESDRDINCREGKLDADGGVCSDYPFLFTFH